MNDNMRAVPTDTTAEVEVRMILRIPNDGGLYRAHEVNTADSEQIERAVTDEITSWWEDLDCEVAIKRVRVLVIRERNP